MSPSDSGGARWWWFCGYCSTLYSDESSVTARLLGDAHMRNYHPDIPHEPYVPEEFK